MSWARQRRPRANSRSGPRWQARAAMPEFAKLFFLIHSQKVKYKVTPSQPRHERIGDPPIADDGSSAWFVSTARTTCGRPCRLECPRDGNGTGCAPMSEHADMIDVAPPALAPQHVSGSILDDDRQPDTDQKPGPTQEETAVEVDDKPSNGAVVARASNPCRRKPRARCPCQLPK